MINIDLKMATESSNWSVLISYKDILLVIVSMQDKRALEQLQQLHTQFKNLVDPKTFSISKITQ